MTTVKQLAKKYNDFSDSIIGSNGYKEIIEPFALTPKKYLEFAETDLGQKDVSPRPALNALSNIKRAADCQADTLLKFWGLYDHSKKNNFRFYHKVELIKRTGIMAPGLLNRINSYRNSAEHDYEVPELDKIKDYYDMVSIFIEYSNVYMKYDFNNSEVVFDPDNDFGDWLRVKFDSEKGEFHIEYLHDVKEDKDGKRQLKKENIKYTTESSYDDYVEFLRVWYSLAI